MIIRCLKRCDFKEFGRDRAYYNFTNTHDLSKYHLKVATGYKASMEIYGGKLLLCTEMAHKLINSASVLDVIDDIFKKNGAQNGKQACVEHLIGQTVMTKLDKFYYFR